MRLIDADALKDRLQTLSYDDWNQGVSTTWANAYAECADMVEDMPTIEPERKSDWIKMSDRDGIYYACNECGEDLMRFRNIYGKLQSVNPTDFCPNCGADMRGEQP